MRQKNRRMNDEKSVLKAAQAVWASNKYFILACSQQHYRRMREYLKPDNMKLNAAYQLLNKINEDFKSVPTEDLPQISNALYHMAGYFKKILSNHERQELNDLIKTSPQKALYQLQNYTDYYKISYLAESNIWPNERQKPFNLVNVSIVGHEVAHPPYQLFWRGFHLIVNDTTDKA